jgi:hypothetical protein
MTDTGNSGFGKFVPGFEFMQNLARQAAGGLAQGMQPVAPQVPSLGNWVAPTFNVEDLDKRIQELKAVHFWLDQNSRALAATIQALEVQKMTLATLQGMNVSMGDVANAMKIKTADAMASMAGFAGMGGRATESPAAQVTPAPEADPAGSAGKVGGMQFAGLEIPPRRSPTAAPAAEAEPTPPPAAPVTQEPAAAPAAPVVDPMQWWGALTQQFQAIATQAMQELPGQTAVEAGKHMATALASEAVKTATEMTAGVARTLTAQAKPGKPSSAKPDAKATEKASASSKKGTAARVSPATKAVAKGATPVARKAKGQSTGPAASARGPQSAGGSRAKPFAKSSVKPAAKAGRAR